MSRYSTFWRRSLATSIMLMMSATLTAAPVPDEFRIKREQVFEFRQKPTVTRAGDRIAVTFESKGLCDATVVVENKEGRIIRHLASGVLGSNAPDPFTKGTRKQALVWDGKDDRGIYVDDKDSHTIRVSLGLKPRFERTLDGHPHKRIGGTTPLYRACPEGVLVFDGRGVDHVRLFDHNGDYKRTIYPFPASTVRKISALKWHTFPQDGQKLPLKKGHVQATLLTSGRSSSGTDIFGQGLAATAMAVGPNGELALAMDRLNRLNMLRGASDLPFEGPDVRQKISLGTIHGFKGGIYDVHPRAMAFSPDGKYLYFACYYWSYAWHRDGLHGVARMEYGKNEPPKLWKGVFTDKRKRKLTPESPDDPLRPSAIAVDLKGRVYVTDYFNDRIQVYAESGKLLKSIPSFKPARIWLHPKTQEIYVGSWFLNGGEWHDYPKRLKRKSVSVPPVFRHMGAFDNPVKKAEYNLPFLKYAHYRNGIRFSGNSHMEKGRLTAIEPDFWADELTLWIVPGSVGISREQQTVKLYTVKKGKLALKRDLGKEAKKIAKRLNPPPFARQRLAVNPKTGHLYLVEQANGTDKNFCQLLRYDPDTGKNRIVELPCHAEDICFDVDGRAYLRVDQGIWRGDSRTWREIPWDYGEEYRGVRFRGTSGGRSTRGVSVLRVPGRRTNPFWHLGGIDISAKGHLLVSTYNGAKAINRRLQKGKDSLMGGQMKPYMPQLFPGRYRWGELHVFDAHGKVVWEDAFPGVGHLDGVGIDAHDNVYVMIGATRLKNGKKFDGVSANVTETLMKAKAGAGKVVSASNRVPVPLAKEARPTRPPDISGNIGAGGSAWVQNAEWMYGGVGFSGINQPAPSCCCWNSRFTLDLLARSFAPEVRHCSVAVLDSAGNLILRVGRYGNVDEGKPLISNPVFGDPKSIGGDEVSLFHAPFVATHTDRRLFIADPGNARVLSVKLGYHAEARVPLSGVPDKEK